MNISPYNPINFHYLTLKRESIERDIQYRYLLKYFPYHYKWSM